jgi:hypothetical protein
MFTLACPQPRARLRLSGSCGISRAQITLIILLGLATTACSTLNAGSAGTANPVQQIVISGSLPPATVGDSYSAVITVSGGTAPYSFATRAGQLPAGLSLNSTTGSISGTPKVPGSYPITISVADKSDAAEGVKSFLFTVKRPVVATPVSVEVAPAALTLAPGATHQFAALVSNATTPAVTWAASAGTVNPMGLFTAPQVSASTSVQLTATSQADPTKVASAAITVEVAAPSTSASLAVTTTSLPDASEGAPYAALLQASGGKTPYQWKLAAGGLPPGFSLAAGPGTIHGVTSQSGAFAFTASVTDASGQSVSHKLAINVALSSTGNFDGPAELPRVQVNSSLADTPAPGLVHPVTSSAALQSALDSAKCGDTISLQAGTTFTGTFVFPAKNCDDNHWIIVRTSAPDSALPPEGTRLTPCHAGVSSLPGRPSLACSSTKNVLAKIEFAGIGSGPIVLADGANHYRLVGLEITRGTPKAVVYNLVINEKNGTSDHLVLDRSWIHGTAQDETTRGIMLSGVTYAAIVDSYLSDFHCVAVTGACIDSQAIGGGLGTNPMGPYKIENNFLEAAGENIIFGGGGATRTPEDIEIRRNFFFKPLVWMKGTPGFVGGRSGHPFIVKNHLEFKNAARVLVEGNVMENSWGGFSQTGYSILLTPKNQNGHCPLCQVHDITIRYGMISHVGNGITIGNGASDSGGLTQGAWNESIHDLIISHVDRTVYNGGGYLFLETSNNGEHPLHDVVIDHVTGIVDNRTTGMLSIGNRADHPLTGFRWTNNLLSAAGGGIITTGGGNANCAFPNFGGGPLGTLDRCFKLYTFAGNILIGATEQWPKDNYAPPSLTSVRIAGSDLNLPRSFLLQAGSPYRNVGTDGKDPGADVTAVENAIAGVAP